MRSFVFIFLVIISVRYNYSASFAILPFIIEQLEPEDITLGPKIFRDNETNSWEFAKLVHTYLSLMGEKEGISIQKIKDHYHSLQLVTQKKLPTTTLIELANSLMASRVLINKISRVKGGFYLETLVFYKSYGSVTETITTYNKDIWVLLNDHFRKLFSFNKIDAITKIKDTPPVLFLLSASGSTYQEVKTLSEIAKSKVFSNTMSCAVDGQDGVFKSANFENSFTIFLSRIKPRGGGTYKSEIFSQKQSHFANRLLKGIECIKEQQNILSKKNTMVKKLVILVDSAVYDGTSIATVKSHLRFLSKNLQILILGSSTLKEEEVVFWKDLTSEISQINKASYKDILYASQVGFATGKEQYIIKKSNRIYTVDSIEDIENINQWNPEWLTPPPNMWQQYDGTNLSQIYSMISGDTIVSHSKVDIYMRSILLNFIVGEKNQNSYNNLHQEARLLVRMGGYIPFWISFPKDVLYQYKIQTGEQYYFLLNMEKGEDGIVLHNTDTVGMVFQDWNRVPQILYLDPQEYLQNQDSFLSHSIGKSSLYIFLGKVEQIKVNVP